MSNFTIKLHNTIDIVNGSIKSESTGFILKFNTKEYIISVHHFIPIIETHFEALPTKIDLPILIKPVWNELIVYEKPSNILFDIFQKIDNIKIKYLKKDERVYLKMHDGELKSFTVNNYKNVIINSDIFHYRANYLEINMSSINPDKSKKPNKNLLKNYQGLSGSPVLDEKNNLVGVFSNVAFTIKNNIIGLIVPSYYILKTLQKKDNQSLYNIDLDDFDNLKFGKYDVKTMIIDEAIQLGVYHPQTKANLPLDIFLSLEGDEDKRIDCIYSDRERVAKFIRVPGFDFSLDIVKKDETVKLNRGLIKIIEMMNSKFKLDNIKWTESNKDIWIEKSII